MLSYVWSFFGGSSDADISLEDCTKILKETAAVASTKNNGNAETDWMHPLNKIKDEFSCDMQTGTITSLNIEGDKYIIDNLYEFDPELKEYTIGCEVSYQRYLENGKFHVYNINIITNDWDTNHTKSSMWSTRLMVGKVEKRDKRVLTLSPGDVKVDLNKVAIEFIPIVGDWLQLDVKHEVNEEAIDLSGKIIEINKISPLRPHIETCTVNKWDSFEGVLNRDIYFNKESLSCGYLPRLGDKVIAELIESDQNGCIWRAIKILPEYIKKSFNKNKGLETIDIKDNHPDLKIDDVSLSFTKLNDSKQFSVKIKNISKKVVVMLSSEFINNSSQCRIVDSVVLKEVKETKSKEALNGNILEENCIIEPEDNTLNSSACNKDNLEENVLNTNNIVPGKASKINIKPEQILGIKCECTPRNIGSSSEFLLLSFQDFKVGKWIQISVENSSTKSYTKIDYNQRRAFNYRVPQYENGENQLVRGQKHNKARFQAVRIPGYPVPKKLLELVYQYDNGRDQTNLIEQLRVTKRSLFTNLSGFNYEEKFHTLLHLDEIQNLIYIQNYDMDRTCFIRNGEFLMLEIENLAERRPSIVLGDRIIASDPLKIRNEDYEGNVFRVGARHVYLKFSCVFHDTYSGEDYSIRVIPGRGSYRRQHHAVFLATRNLGNDWLFPTKIVEKELQVKFSFDPYPTIIKTPSKTQPNPASKKKLTPGELFRKIRESNDKKNGLKGDSSIGNSSSDESGETLPKIKWYNKNLNCKQKDAVINILKGTGRPLPYIIFGPPGTGKTVTVIEATLQIMKFIPESRLLVAAPSNSAADLIALRLIESGCLRPGILVRLVSMNYATGDYIPAKLVPFCAAAGIAKEGTADENILGKDGIIYDCSREVLGRHKITVTTCSSAGSLYNLGFPRGHFTHIIVDESGQAAEPEVMIPISFFDKWNGHVILAGDPMQLGPVVLSQIAGECGLNESFLERLTNRFPYVRDPEGFPDTEGYDPRLVTKLLYNYRSLETILNLFSNLFYHNDLIPTISSVDSPEANLLNSLAAILPQRTDGSVPAMVFHGVHGENYQTADSPSWLNPHEAAQVFYYVNEFYRLGLKEENIGIITPYVKQVKEIRNLLNEAEFPVPRIGTVEEFQGQEYDVVLLSTVRSSQDFIPSDLEHSLGFVSSPRRLNVAISRPKSLLIIIGNPNLLCYDTYWRNVINYCVQNGAYTGCDWATA